MPSSGWLLIVTFSKLAPPSSYVKGAIMSINKLPLSLFLLPSLS